MAKERSIDRIPPDLEEWIRKGGAVRDDLTLPFAGRCGGVVQRPNGSQNDGGSWCQRGAGWGTDHPGYGRCRHHEGQYELEGALSPWVGPLTDEEWTALVGAMAPGGEVRHGASFIQRIRESWDQWLEASLEPEELYAYKTMPTDPLTLLDQEIKLNRLAMARIQRWLRTQRAMSDMNPWSLGGTPRSLEISQAENQLLKLSAAFARLMEVRARISEVETGERWQEMTEDVLRRMPDEEFQNLLAQPERMMLFLNQGAVRGRGIGEPEE